VILPCALVDAWVAEDAPYGDLTTRALDIGMIAARIRFAPRAPAVVCCVEEVESLLQRNGACVRRLRSSGEWAAAGEVILEAEGEAQALHLVWRTAQTLLEQAAGIATATRRIVEAARGAAPEIAVECTRKAVPGARAWSTRAVLAGGGAMHRLGLSESILVFAEHAALLGGWDGVYAKIPAIRQANPGKKITAEAKTPGEARALAEAGVDIVQVDKFSPSDVAALVEHASRLSPAPLVVATGGIDIGNAAAYAATGCAALVTSAPYWARPIDVQVTIVPATTATVPATTATG